LGEIVKAVGKYRQGGLESAQMFGESFEVLVEVPSTGFDKTLVAYIYVRMENLAAPPSHNQHVSCCFETFTAPSRVL
jgi:hypothetical protein